MPSQPRYPYRVRNELRLRELTVLDTQPVTATFRRITLGGEALTGFSSAGFADHCKLFFAPTDSPLAIPEMTGQGAAWPGGVKPPSRDYTPLYDAQRQTLTFDFYLHDGGIASQWAMGAHIGDTLLVGGPRGSTVFPEEYPWQLYVTDESGLPALRRRLEDLRQGDCTPQITALIVLNNVEDQAYLAGFEDANIEWFSHQSGDALDARLQQIEVPEQGYFIWITGEGTRTRHYARHFDSCAIDPQLCHVSAYWHRK
ncbi:TPA: siderophore-interacting protein [Klebsiella pneumoniae]|nr:siderophore-interacting protein [Klebsiella pneumoniae]